MSHLNINICEQIIILLKKYSIFPETLNHFFVPKFMPQQKQNWECGYFVLVFIKIIMDNIFQKMITPISRHQITITHKIWITYITENNDVNTFLYFLRDSLKNMKNINIYANI